MMDTFHFGRRAALLAGVAALAFAHAIPVSAQTPKDTVVMAKQIDDIISMDPGESFEFSGSEAVTNIYDRLIRFDLADVSKLYGSLADSWSVGSDGKTYTIKLKPGIKFHSGNPVTSEDVVYSFTRAVTLNKSPGFILTQFGFNKDNVKDRIKAVDPLTVTLTVEKPFAPTFFYYCLTSTVASVVDSKLVKANEKDGDFGNAWLKTNSAGSGPYKLVSWKASESYTLQANDTWFRGKPANKRVVVRHVAEPASQRLLLEKGDVDFARNLTKDQLEAIRKNDAVQVMQGRKGSILYLGLNQKNANLKKPEVREALKWLTDYDALEANIVRGTYVQHQAFLPVGFLGALSDRPYKYDVAKAKALLTKAGLADGFSVTMDTRNNSPIIDIAQALQAQWAKAGVKLEIIPGDGRQTLTKYRARNHDIYIGAWGPDYQDPHTNAETFAINENNADDAKSKTLAWRNSWDIPEMTKKTAALVLEQDAKKREAGYLEIQKEHQKTSPFVIMFQQIEVTAHRKGVDGFILGPSFDNNFYYNIAKK